MGFYTSGLANRGYLVNKKNKDNNDTTPALDLSFAYGTAVMKQLNQSDIERMAANDAAADESSTGDTTIRAVTSLFTGKRSIVDIVEREEPEVPE